MASEPPLVLVAGDVCIDWFIMPTPRALPAQGIALQNWQLREGLQMYAYDGGVWLLGGLIRSAVDAQVIFPDTLKERENEDCTKALHSMIELEAFPLGTEGGGAKKKAKRKEKVAKVWRVGTFRGFAGPEPGQQRVLHILNDDNVGAPNLVVLDDVGNGFRDADKEWPRVIEQGTDVPIIWKLSRPLHQGKLRDVLVEKHAQTTIAVIDVNDLRAEGAMVSARLSWERTVRDTLRALEGDPRFAHLRKLKHLVVRLGQEGALHVEHTGSGEPRMTLTYWPTRIEGSISSEVEGRMFGSNSTFVSMMAASVLKRGYDGIDEGIANGLTMCLKLFREGFGPPSEKHGIRPPDLRMQFTTIHGKDFGKDFKQDPGLVPVNVGPMVLSPSPWACLLEVKDGGMEALARGIVRKGIGSAQGKAPIASFGELVTLDRFEIESFRSVRNLMQEYLLPNTQVERPLSLGVFGPPGSGKSFGVEEVAKSLGEVEKLEFNLSQFDSARQLNSAFHLIRDAVVRGRLPLVFFDEFDAAGPNSDPMGWLKYFLAPMQDGKFMDGGSVHHIGKAIFVFAGGTSRTFAEFARLKDMDPTRLTDFRAVKGPDFVSRLRGFIDIRGIVRREPTDDMVMIRRAVLLRSLLERKWPHLLDVNDHLCIDENVLSAFLRCRTFHHGARSLQAVIEMSSLSGREVFESSCLPSRQQLELHVEADAFLATVTQDVRFAERRETIARAIHRDYIGDMKKKQAQIGKEVDTSWEGLPHYNKEDNLAQADNIPLQLASIGFGFEAAPDLKAITPITFTVEHVEELAKREHKRWCDEKERQGFVYGPVRNTQGPFTLPDLVPWDAPDKDHPGLSDEAKQKDRDTVSKIPEHLAEAGLRIIELRPVGAAS